MKPNEDVLKIRLSEERKPEVRRFGNENRIAITFERTEAALSLKNLILNRRGNCVEKFETQMSSRGAVMGPSGGIRFLDTPVSLILLAYVESDVEAQVYADGTEVTIHYFRIGQEPSQTRPLPINSIDYIDFTRDGLHQVVTVRMAKSMTPSLYEEVNPHRILLSFPNTVVTEKAKNEIRRYMETAGIVRAESFTLGALPKPYDALDESREYHFVGFPSLYDVNEFLEAGPGIESRDSIIAIYPEKDVDYMVTLKGGPVYEIVFTKQFKIRERSCGFYEVVPEQAKSDVYPLEDESGRRLTPKN